MTAKLPKGSKPLKVQWTLENSRAANKQGWDLCDAGGRFEIEVNTEHPAGFGEGNDDDAVAWLIGRACKGDGLAAKGLLIAGLLDPQWFAADLTHAVKTGRVTVMDTLKQPSKLYSVVAYRSDADPKPRDLEARVKKLEDAIRKAIDFGDGHAWWDSEGNAKIESGGHKLLKETLEATA